jgi:hypothetical protein
MPTTNLSKHQKGIYYIGIKLSKNRSSVGKYLNHDMKLFKPALKEYLLSHSFHSVGFTLIKNTPL